MINFDDNEYEKMIGDLINDTFYVNNSKRGKIKGIRQFSEVLVRKVLNIGSSRMLMLGRLREPGFTSSGLRTGGAKEELDLLSLQRKNELLAIVEDIRPLGNEGTHTGHVEEFTDEELSKVINGLFDLYAFLFIDYFLEFPMILLSPAEVMHDFSLLPPIIRYKVLNYLYKKNPNLQISNRLCLAIIKTYGKSEAYRWLDQEKMVLKSLKYPSDIEIMEYTMLRGEEIKPGFYKVNLMLSNYNNVYDLLVDKVKDIRTSINESGKMYSNFEEAKRYYQNNKHEDSTEELSRLHSLMDFVYLGRKSM